MEMMTIQEIADIVLAFYTDPVRAQEYIDLEVVPSPLHKFNDIIQSEHNQQYYLVTNINATLIGLGDNEAEFGWVYEVQNTDSKEKSYYVIGAITNKGKHLQKIIGAK